jgi:histidine ammonia-lyase
MNNELYIGKDHLTAFLAIELAKNQCEIRIDDETKARIKKSAIIVEKIAKGSKVVYGINTGFGPLCNTKISAENTSILQENLLRSHSVGVGRFIDPFIAKIMMVLKLHSLSKGFSGIQWEIIERIKWMIENDIIPAVPEQGSVGASGDLAPLSHLFLPLIGEGQVYYNEVLYETKEIFAKLNISSCSLGPKDGLALINGTQFIAAHAILLLEKFYANLSHSDISGAMILDALNGSIMPFRRELHELRPFKGNQHVAARITSFISDSEILLHHENCEKVQDPYSLRCIPQVHGASRTSWLHLKECLEIELNAVTDNPIIFNEDHTISGGNFHGQPMALPIDYACFALSEIGNIADRRMYLSLEGKCEDLPKLLMREIGLNSGFMILQYTAAALASENKTLCFPASADSITTSLGQEDHVSMGSIGVIKALKVAENVEKILAIEMLLAAQALDFRRPLKSGSVIENIHTHFRSKICHAEKDRIFSKDINISKSMLESRRIIEITKELQNDNYSDYDELFEVY